MFRYSSQGRTSVWKETKMTKWRELLPSVPSAFHQSNYTYRQSLSVRRSNTFYSPRLDHAYESVSLEQSERDLLDLTPNQLCFPHSFYPKPVLVLPAKIRSFLGWNGKADENTFFSNQSQRNYSSVLAKIKVRQAPGMDGFCTALRNYI